MGDIPVTFEYKGKEYKARFSNVAGGGSSSIFHLYVGKIYWGQLNYIQAHPPFAGMPARPEAWRFTSNSAPELDELSSDFGFVVECYYASYFPTDTIK